jgi:hypothetical protein
MIKFLMALAQMACLAPSFLALNFNLMKSIFRLFIALLLICPTSSYAQAQENHQFRFNAQYGWMQHSQMGAIFAGPEWAFGRGKHQMLIGATFGFAEGNRNLSREAMERGGLLYGYYGIPTPPFLAIQGRRSSFPEVLMHYEFPKSSTTHQLGGRLGYQFLHHTQKLQFGVGGGWFVNYVDKHYIATILEDVVATSPFEETFVIDLDIHYWVRYLHMGPFVQGHIQLARKGSVQPGVSLAYHHGFGGIGWVSAGLQVAFGM